MRTANADASSSSTGPPPDQPDGVPPNWTLSLDGFDGYALEVLDEGRIAVGGGFFEESVPGVPQQMITTTEGDIHVAGVALTDQTTTAFPEYDGLVFWVQRLDPDGGASVRRWARW